MRTLDILEFLARQNRPMAAHELATALAIPVSSLSYLLSTLVERGYVQRVGRRFASGPAVAQLQPQAGGSSLAERVAPLVRGIGQQLNETTSFFVQRAFEIEALATEVGRQALRYSLEVGQRAPMHAFSAGKALLAQLDETELAHYFATVERRAFTAHTITEEAALRAELAEVRRTGIARTREENSPGIVGLARAAAIDGQIAGAFSVAIPIARLTDELERKAIDLISRAADMLSKPAAL
ncbi:MAG: helix-turn-helix domain-containing protein [Hydrogenophilaceae bacterium]|nr:helix-turn-helix domain-containing protein [Hydrogenophilaceae bacterium]